MAPVEVTSFDDHVMETDEHGLRFPRNARPILPSLIDIVIAPGLAFDDRGHRLGRGGGFYDRFLKRIRQTATTVGLAYDAQIVPRRPRRSARSSARHGGDRSPRDAREDEVAPRLRGLAAAADRNGS